MARKSLGLSERHKKILVFLEKYQKDFGYPPSIREIGDGTSITSTSVVNYYLEQLVKMGFIQREDHISRGIRLLKPTMQRMAQTVAEAVNDLIQIPVIGRIFASQPVPMPASDFNYYDPESGIEIARSLLPARERIAELFALEVQGDSMIDAMVNDGDIVIMKRVDEAKNGEMVAVWLKDRDETTLKYFYQENGRVRLQPANPTMLPIYIEDPHILQIQGKVVLVIRRMQPAAA